MISLLPTALMQWQRRLRVAVVALLSMTALGLMSAQHAAAATWPYTQSATPVSLPAGALPGARYFGQYATACATADSCVAVGRFNDSSSTYQADVVPITDGVVGQAIRVTLPSDAATTNQLASLEGVACQSGNTCEAYGYYVDSSNIQTPMFVQITDGQPAQAVPLSAPADSSGMQNVTLSAISCPTTGACEAVGQYFSTTANSHIPLTVAIVNGVPAQGVAAPLPANRYAGDASGELVGVACQSGGLCTAVGDYYDTHDDDVPLVVGITNGAPGAAVEPPTPADASTSAPYATLDYVGCPQSGTCQAVGYYEGPSGEETMVVSLNGAAPVAASSVAPPAGALSYDRVYVSGISCSSASLCVAAGYDYYSGGNYQAAVVTITGSAISVQTETLPSNQYSARQDAAFYTESEGSSSNPVACVPGGPCLTGGYYNTTSSSVYAGLVGQISTSGVLSPGQQTPMPAGEPTGSGANDYLYYGTGCVVAGSCVSTGEYVNSASQWVPYVVAEQAPLSVSTASLAGASQGSAYSASLSASGGWGSYNWSVASGALPAGLSLDAQSGVISGTPSASGPFSFTVQANAPGSPAQTVSVPLSITVAALPLSPPPPSVVVVAKATVRLLRAGGRLKGFRSGVRLSCAGASCRGVVKIETREVFFVRHGKRRVRRVRTVVIGTARFSAAAGRSRALSVALDGLGRRLLEHARGHRLSVQVIVSALGGNRSSRHATIWSAVRRHGKPGKHRKHRNKG